MNKTVSQLSEMKIKKPISLREWNRMRLRETILLGCVGNLLLLNEGMAEGKAPVLLAGLGAIVVLNLIKQRQVEVVDECAKQAEARAAKVEYWVYALVLSAIFVGSIQQETVSSATICLVIFNGLVLGHVAGRFAFELYDRKGLN